MMIAGCLNQAKRILEKFDEILQTGTKPEVLVQKTHATIRRLLQSEDCSAFLRECDSAEEASIRSGETFVSSIYVS